MSLNPAVRYSAAAAALAALAVLALGDVAGAGAPSNGTREVMEVLQAWNRAFARNDVEAYFSYIDDGITLLTPSSPYRVEGIADDKETDVLVKRDGRWRIVHIHVSATP